jgi:hypothetical protein
VQGIANEGAAKVAREMHPLRMQRWAFSDLNPWMVALKPAAAAVRAQRRAMAPEAAPRRMERYLSGMLSASLEYYRAARDAVSEAAFFQIYGNLLALDAPSMTPAPSGAVREQPFAKRALESMSSGGYTEAAARVAALLTRTGEPIPLAKLELKRDLVKEYGELVPRVSADEWRRIRGEQEVVVELEPERAVGTLRDLVAREADRRRLAALLDRLEADAREHVGGPSPEQAAMLARIRDVIGAQPRRLRAPARKRARAAA